MPAKNFFTMNPKEMIALSASAALMLTEGLGAERANTLANFLMAVGQNISSALGQYQPEDEKNGASSGAPEGVPPITTPR